jgi:hypothetical protein
VPVHSAAGRSEEVQTDGQEPLEQYCEACANDEDNDPERATHRCEECGPMCKVIVFTKQSVVACG